jgi:nickel-dependent lactate racemase
VEDLRCKIFEFLSYFVSQKQDVREDFKVLLLPPDYTRVHSQAGIITQIISEYFSSDIEKFSMTILPALGTHSPMTPLQKEKMFGAVASSATFVDHDWRKDVVTIGHVPAQYVTEATDGLVIDTPWPAQLNKLVWEGNHSLILSIGQVVPHEVGFSSLYLPSSLS